MKSALIHTSVSVLVITAFTQRVVHKQMKIVVITS